MNQDAKRSLTHYDEVAIDLYDDFMQICDYETYGITCIQKEKPSLECMAKLLNYFENESQGHYSDSISASMEELIVFATLRCDSDATIRKSLSMLERLGYITRYQQSGKTNEYLLHRNIIQQALNNLTKKTCLLCNENKFARRFMKRKTNEPAIKDYICTACYNLLEDKMKKHGKRASDTLNINHWLLVLEASNGLCAYCQEYIGEQFLTIDHIIPITKGGKNDQNNIAAACLPCNIRKGARLL